MLLYILPPEPTGLQLILGAIVAGLKQRALLCGESVCSPWQAASSFDPEDVAMHVAALQEKRGLLRRLAAVWRRSSRGLVAGVGYDLWGC